MLTPPFTAGELLGVASEEFMLPENIPTVRAKPRASSIGDCARKIAYMMANTEVTDPGEDDGEITTEQGRIVDEAISQRLVRRLGEKRGDNIRVVNTQVALPDGFPMTGHPDGELSYGDEMRDVDGLLWGYEHKHLGRWGYEKTFKEGIEVGEPVYLCQMISYGLALGWDAVAAVILAQDSSSTKSDAQQNLKAKNPGQRWAVNPDWNPKMLVYCLDLRQYYNTLGRRLIDRANWFIDWAANDGNPDNVQAEYSPEDVKPHYTVVEGEPVEEFIPNFPCSHCEWLTRCRESGPDGRTAPELPFRV